MSSSSSLSNRKIDDTVDGEFPSPINPTAVRKDPRSPTAADPLQFFVRILSDHTLVLRADPGDTVRSIHEKIKSITDIPLFEQRLIYRGKQLKWEQTLSECGIENDAGLHLVGRIRSTGHPRSWMIINEVISSAFYLFKNPPTQSSIYIASQNTVRYMLIEFLNMTPRIDPDLAYGHLQIFTASSVPTALIMLYMSSHKPNRDVADYAIRDFGSFCKTFLSKHCYHQCVPIMMEFCRLLRGALGAENSLYGVCRSNLGTVMKSMEFGKNEGSVWLREIFPFLAELAARLSCDLVKRMESASFWTPSFCTIPLTTDVNDFSMFVGLVKNLIKGDKRFCGPIQVPLREGLVSFPLCFADEIINLHGIFSDLLSKMKNRMMKIEVELENAKRSNGRLLNVGGQFLVILKELNCISKIYHGCEEVFWESMKQRKEALCYLIISIAKWSDDHNWISECKEATNFETRRHLAALLIPEANDDYDEQHEMMIIDRADLFSESYYFIINTDLSFLRYGSFMKFKNEEAIGPGVLREWFLLVCQEIFNPEKKLFVACSEDRTRFYPRPASSVDPLDCDYFKFAGKVIAMALMHNVQVGIVFDRSFFLQLGGHSITLEDIRDADPSLYNSFKKILEMDPEEIDQHASDQMLVYKIHGENVAVNSKNRRRFVEATIQDRFVKETAVQIDHFAMGFADIFGCRNLQRSFFRCLNLEDFDLMIRGRESEICVDDWKAHTKYNDFDENDEQISWFWEIVGGMTNEEKRALLFFWTSIKYLPMKGFSGLESPLQIIKSFERPDHLPTSHTCFYQLCFPAYSNMAEMRERLSIITQGHVSCSFGTL